MLAGDLDTVKVDSLKALDLSRPIREADIGDMRRIQFRSKETAACNPTVGRKLGSVFSRRTESEFRALAPERRHLRLQRPRILLLAHTGM